MKQSEYLRILDEVTKSLSRLNYAEQFLDQCPEFLRKRLPVDQLHLFYINNEKQAFKHYPPRRDSGDSLRPVSTGTHLVTELKNAGESLIISNENRTKLKILMKDNRELFDRLAPDIIVPLISLGGLGGFITLRSGKKARREWQPMTLFFNLFANILIPPVTFERERIESERNYYRIYRMDRLALVGELAASAAHEIKNPLAGISTYITYFLENPDIDRDDFREELTVMKQSTQRINNIVRSLLSFSKHTRKKITKIRLADLIDSTIQSIALKIRSGIDLTVEADPAHVVESDAQRLQQVLINVLFNALDALGKGPGEIRIRTSVTGRDQLPENEMYNIIVRDNGPGIPDSFKARLFQPFQTTKEEGTGLGLYTCYGLMKSLGGDIRITSPKQGTEVTLALPYAGEEEID